MKDRQNGGNLYSHTAGWKQRQLRYGMNLKLIYDRIRGELLSRSAIAWPHYYIAEPCRGS